VSDIQGFMRRRLLSNILHLLVCGFLIVTSGALCCAQQTFHVRNVSASYDVDITIETCDEKQNDCSGPGQVVLYRSGSTSAFQTLKLTNIELAKDQIAYTAQGAKPRSLYDDSYSLVFEDFNFDGIEDLAIRNGNNGGYGGPSYTVYLYNVKLNRFVENVSLSKLAEGGYLNLFFVDQKKKRLEAYSKSGCCYHQTDIFKLRNNKPFLVERVMEDAEGTDDTGYIVTTTTKTLVNGKWVKRVRRKKVKPESDN